MGSWDSVCVCVREREMGTAVEAISKSNREQCPKCGPGFGHFLVVVIYVVIFSLGIRESESVKVTLLKQA